MHDKKKKAPILLFFLIGCFGLSLFGCNERGQNAPAQASVLAMDTTFHLTFAPETDAAVCANAVASLQNLSAEFDCHDSQSLTGRLNTEGTLVCPTMQLPSLITQTLSLEERFGDAVQLTCRPLTALWGINHSDPTPAICPSEEEIADVRARVDDTLLSVNDQTISLAAGASLDLGAVGKGYAMDVLAEDLTQTSVPYAVISAVSSVLLYGQKPLNAPFSVQVTNPLTDGVLGTVSIQHSSAQQVTHVGTSGGSERWITIDGNRYCHLLDLSTGYPSCSDLAAVSVFTDSGVKADFLSTFLFLGGTDGLQTYLQANDYQVLAVSQSGDVFCSEGLSFTSYEAST